MTNVPPVILLRTGSCRVLIVCVRMGIMISRQLAIIPVPNAILLWLFAIFALSVQSAHNAYPITTCILQVGKLSARSATSTAKLVMEPQQTAHPVTRWPITEYFLGPLAHAYPVLLVLGGVCLACPARNLLKGVWIVRIRRTVLRVILAIIWRLSRHLIARVWLARIIVLVVRSMGLATQSAVAVHPAPIEH